MGGYPLWGGTLRWAWKTHFFNTIWKEIDHFGGPVFLLKRSSLGTSDIQYCCSPKGIAYLIIIHEGDPIPCRTTYIENRSPVKIFIIFLKEGHLSPLAFIATYFFQFYDAGRGGYPSVSLKRSFFKTIWKEIDHFGGPVFLLKRSILGTSDIQGCYSPNGITYIIYTLLSGRDKIPFRTTYIEYRSPVKIFIHFIGFHCKNMCLVIVSRHRSRGIPFGELEKLIFLIQCIKKNNHFGGPVFCGLQTSRIAAPPRELCI